MVSEEYDFLTFCINEEAGDDLDVRMKAMSRFYPLSLSSTCSLHTGSVLKTELHSEALELSPSAHGLHQQASCRVVMKGAGVSKPDPSRQLGAECTRCCLTAGGGTTSPGVKRPIKRSASPRGAA